MNISFWSLEQLNRWEAFQFLYDVIKFTDSHAAGMPELFNTKLEAFRTAFEAYDEALVQERKLTPKELVAAEEGRDLAIRKIYALVREYAEFPYEPEKETAANLLLNIFRSYGTGSSIAILPQDEETAVLINLLQDLKKEQATITAIDTLELQSAVDALEQNNTSFVEMQHQRTKDDARVVLGIVKSTRTEAQNEFVSFAQLVNALALVEGEEKYADLKLEINRLHKNVMDRAKKRSKKKGDVTEPEVEV